MQHGSLERNSRKRGPDVWQFRRLENSPDGKRLYHKKIVGTVAQYSFTRLFMEPGITKKRSGLSFGLHLRLCRLRQPLPRLLQLVRIGPVDQPSHLLSREGLALGQLE
jgi:hypothetical protein